MQRTGFGLAIALTFALVAACQKQEASPTAPTPTVTVSVTGADVLESIGDTGTLVATQTTGGQSSDITGAALWVTDDPAVVAIVSAGVIQAKDVGAAQITVSYQGKTATRRVVVARAEDCFVYSPLGMQLLADPSGDSWTLAYPFGGVGYILIQTFSTADDAADGLSLAKANGRYCYSGRIYTGADRASLIVKYWDHPNGTMATFNREDCEPYNTSQLTLRTNGSSGWSVWDGSRAVANLHFEVDAARILTVARQYSVRCFIGRGRNDGQDYATSYFK